LTFNPSSLDTDPELRGEAERCRRRIQSALVRNNQGNPYAVDHLILTGGASRLALFRREVVEPLCDWLRREAPEGQVVLEDLGARAKEVVACGAALATYYRDCSPTSPSAATGRLHFAVDQFDRRLPYGIAYNSGGAFQQLFARGAEFPVEGDGLGPLRASIVWQHTVTLFRFPSLDLKREFALYPGAGRPAARGARSGSRSRSAAVSRPPHRGALRRDGILARVIGRDPAPMKQGISESSIFSNKPALCRLTEVPVRP
jgi:hypothetical protein